MKNELITTQHLVGPSISGTVSVPLAELDKMRSDHLQALNTAKELEAKQALIKITIHQYEKYVDHVNDIRRNRHGNEEVYQIRAVTKERLVERDTIYVNFDELRQPITEIERSKVENELNDLRKQINDLIKTREYKSNYIVELKEVIEKSEKELKDSNELNTQLNTQFEELLKVANEATSLVQNHINTIDDLQKRLTETEQLAHKWRFKKSLWYSIYTLIKGE